MTTIIDDSAKQKKLAYIATLSSFLLWGSLPLYWQLFFHMPLWELVSYRVIFSLIFVTMVLTWLGLWGSVVALVTNKRTLLLLILSGITIGVNWVTYVWAIASKNVLDASMGYYINPLFNLIIGFTFFKERPRPLQLLALFVAFSGVMYSLIMYGKFPFFAIVLATSFALYGALHKVLKVQPLSGLFIEMVVAGFPAVAYLIWLAGGSGLTISTDPLWLNIALALAGVLTTLPLMGFSYGVHRLPLSTVGILQYISPTATFLLGLLFFNEKLTNPKIVMFIAIWIAVTVYMYDGLRHMSIVRKVKLTK